MTWVIFFSAPNRFISDFDRQKVLNFAFRVDCFVDDEESDSGVDDDNENENYKKKKSKSKTQKQVKNSKDKVFTPYPLYVKVTFSVKSKIVGFTKNLIKFFLKTLQTKKTLFKMLAK